jgi:chemotaxis protein MotB
MAKADNQPLIIKKVKKGGGHGHHGGSWKVAYADFVTAMMAFFMLLWLLNVTTDEQKQGIADYFAPASASRTTSGSGGILGGKTLVSEGSRISENGVPSVAISLTPPARPTDQDVYNDFEQEQTGSGESEEERMAKALVEQEEKAFEEAQEALKKAIEEVPALADLGEHLMIDMTPEGLRIQLVDREQESMFPSGSAEMHEFTRALLERIALVVGKLPNKIAVSGHTDATPYRSSNGYTNWELSTDRANASRRVLLEAGLDSGRIERVIGRAANDPLLPDDPFNATNRRISIVLLREAELLPENKAPRAPETLKVDPVGPLPPEEQPEQQAEQP